MTSIPAPSERPEAPVFSDGLGDRAIAVDGATGDLLQILRLRPQLLSVPSFEFALRERAARLANFRHAYYARVRRIDRHGAMLTVVSDHVEGTRLSELLRITADRRLTLDLNAALCLIRQLVPAVALLHENARDVAHGLLAPERLVVTPHARVIIVEHVLGSAVEQLQYPSDRLWHELGAVLSSTATGRFDHRADVVAIGMVALALVLGRPIAIDEYPNRIPQLLLDARARSAMGDEEPLPYELRSWLGRMLQIDHKPGFASAVDAQTALEDTLSEDTGFVAAPVALETFLSRYIAALLEPPAPAALPTVAPSTPQPLPAAVSAPRVAAPPAKPISVPPAAAAPAPIPAVAPAALPAPVSVAPTVPRPAPPPVAAASVAPVPSPATTSASSTLAQGPATISAGASATAPAPSPSTPPDITELLKDVPGVIPPSPVEAQAPSRGGSRVGKTKKFMWMAAAAAVVAMVGVPSWYYAARGRKPAAAASTGTLAVQTNPAGVAVFVDGVAHGNTPARISVPAGSHILELRGRGVPRVVPVQIAAGAEVSQYLELPEAPVTGSLLVQSDPAGAHVSIDGADHGVAPVSVADLSPGEHEVVLTGSAGVPVKQKVVIQAGVTSSVLAPVSTAAPGPVSGWLAVKAPVTIEIHEGDRLLGTSDSDKIMLAAGRHEVQLVNETLGYTARRVVQVPPGRILSLPIELPQGVINLNATPWAEVWIDGRRIGETPIGNLPIAIGPHEVVFRNPQLGEKHQAVSVTLSAPVRLSVDMK